MHNQSHKTYRSSFDLHRLNTLAVLGAVGTASLVSTVVPAEAAPVYRRDRNWNRGNANVTITGVVQRDLSGNDRFTVRLDNGRTVEVISRDREPLRLSRGDRVELRGDFERGLFIADRVRIIRNNGVQSVIRGIVSRDYSGREFSLRLDSGRTVTVRVERAEPLRLTRGDRVEARGRYQGNLFLARNVTIRRNDDRRSVDFTGTVIRREGYNRLIVRVDNRRTYTIVAPFSVSRFDSNDRVHVTGIVTGNTVTASRVELLRDR